MRSVVPAHAMSSAARDALAGSGHAIDRLVESLAKVERELACCGEMLVIEEVRAEASDLAVHLIAVKDRIRRALWNAQVAGDGAEV